MIEAVDAAAPGRDLMLKWPNDLMLANAKLGGILLERAGDRVIAGFGVNLATAPRIDGRVTADLGAAVAPKAFAPLLAASFSRLLDAWRSADIVAFAQAWLARAHPIGTALAVHAGAGETIAGTFAGIEPDGALRLASGGQVQIVRAGDVYLG